MGRLQKIEPSRTVVLAAVAAFMWAGPLKQIPPFSSSPIDLTLLSAGFAFGGAAMLLVTSRAVPLPNALFGCFLMVLLALAGSATNVLTLDAAQKEFSLYSATIPVAATLAVAISHRDHFVRFAFWATGWAMYASLALLAVGQPDQSGRLVSELGTTISFGRAAGFVLVVVGAWLLTQERVVDRRLVAVLAVGGIELFVLFSVASRGPVQAVALAGAAMVVAQFGRMRVRDGARIMALAGLAFVGLVIAWSTTPDFSRLRILSFFEDRGQSDVRALIYRWTLDNLPSSPVGNGWGSWTVISGFTSVRYPHNIFLEILFEAGVVGLLVFCLLVFRALRHKMRTVTRDGFLGVLAIGLVIYWLSAAFVSGDINDNRGLFIMLIAASALPRTSQGPPPVPAMAVRAPTPANGEG